MNACVFNQTRISQDNWLPSSSTGKEFLIGVYVKDQEIFWKENVGFQTLKNNATSVK